MPKNSQGKSNKKNEINNPGKCAKISRIPSPVLSKLSKEVLSKSKIFNKKDKKPVKNSNTKKGQLYVQASLSNIKEILKIKENFLSLSTKKIEEIYKIINKPRKNKPKFNMTTKRSLRKQILVSMS